MRRIFINKVIYVSVVFKYQVNCVPTSLIQLISVTTQKTPQGRIVFEKFGFVLLDTIIITVFVFY